MDSSGPESWQVPKRSRCGLFGPPKAHAPGLWAQGRYAHCSLLLVPACRPYRQQWLTTHQEGISCSRKYHGISYLTSKAPTRVDSRTIPIHHTADPKVHRSAGDLPISRYKFGTTEREKKRLP